MKHAEVKQLRTDIHKQFVIVDTFLRRKQLLAKMKESSTHKK